MIQTIKLGLKKGNLSCWFLVIMFLLEEVLQEFICYLYYHKEWLLDIKTLLKVYIERYSSAGKTIGTVSSNWPTPSPSSELLLLLLLLCVPLIILEI